MVPKEVMELPANELQVIKLPLEEIKKCFLTSEWYDKALFSRSVKYP